jgi:hypothetical protein
MTVLKLLAGVAVGAYLLRLTGRVADLESEVAQLRVYVVDELVPIVDTHAERIEALDERTFPR